MATKGFQKSYRVSTIKGTDTQVEKALRDLTKVKGFSNLPKSLLRDLKLVLMEGVSNSFQHGGANRKNPVKIVLKADPKKIEITIEDRGPGFSLTGALRKQPNELAAGGRGLWIMKNLVDHLSYRKGKPNRLILTRRLTRPKSLDSALELFDKLQDSIQNLKPLSVLYDEFIDYVVDLFNVERASFLIFDPNKKVLKVATSRGIPKQVAKKISIAPGKEIAGYVFATGRPLLVQNLSTMKKAGLQPRKKGYTTKSFISVPVIASPLHIGEETLGVLNLTDKRDGKGFTGIELKLLNLMAFQAATAFRIRNLIDVVKRNEGLNRELEIVRDIQDRLITGDFPKISGTRMAGHCKLSERGGGDYYDVLKVNGLLRGVVADVSGHNVGSAITMASFRSIYRSLVFDPNTPGKLLLALRWVMYEELIKLQHFISCWVFEYDPKGILKVSGAGHPPIMVYRPKKNHWMNYYSQHLPLGLEDDTRPQNTRIKIEKGDLVFFYTDGLFDPRMRATGFDRQNIIDLVSSIANQSPEKIVDKIFKEMSPHHLLLRAPDDVALLVLKRR